MNLGKKKKDKESKEAKETKKQAKKSGVSRDQIYAFDEDHIKTLYKERPWQKDVKFFKNCKISALAATKMLKHALAGVKKGREGPGGTPIEIMGLLVGNADGNSIIVKDACPLPVEGIEYKVEAAEEAQGYMVSLLDSLEVRRPEAFCGWYHSHPFDVDTKPFYFLSSTDVSTQTLWQNSSPIWTAIVVDPLRSLAKQEPQLGCFRVYPAEHNPPKLEGPDGRRYASVDEMKIRWGATPNRYYQMEHTYFLSNLGGRMLDIMSRNNLWIRVLSTSSILEPENRIRFPERLAKASEKLQSAASSSGGGRYPGALISQAKRGSGFGPKNKEAILKEGAAQCAELAIEQCNGHASQISKNVLFNYLKRIEERKVDEEKKE